MSNLDCITYASTGMVVHGVTAIQIRRTQIADAALGEYVTVLLDTVDRGVISINAYLQTPAAEIEATCAIVLRAVPAAKLAVAA